MEVVDKYKVIFELSPQAIVILDKKGKLLDFNNRLFEWLGYSREEVLGKNLLRLPFLPKHSKIKVMENFTKRMLGKKVPAYELDFVSKSGAKRVGLITAEPIRDAKGKIMEDLVMISDVTDKRNVEEELREKIEELQNLNSLMVNRELKMVELKNKLKKMEGR